MVFQIITPADVKDEDLTESWNQFVQERLKAHEMNHDSLVRIHGEEVRLRKLAAELTLIMTCLAGSDRPRLFLQHHCKPIPGRTFGYAESRFRVLSITGVHFLGRWASNCGSETQQLKCSLS
jgi:hypothetical protein